MTLHRARGAALAVTLTFYTGAAFGQTTATLTGTVTDPTNAAVPGATVTVKSTETGAIRVAATDEGGNFRAVALPVGPVAFPRAPGPG